MATTKEIQAELQELDRQIEDLQEQRRYKHAELMEAIHAQDLSRAEKAAKAREDAKRIRGEI